MLVNPNGRPILSDTAEEEKVDGVKRMAMTFQKVADLLAAERCTTKEGVGIAGNLVLNHLRVQPSSDVMVREANAIFAVLKQSIDRMIADTMLTEKVKHKLRAEGNNPGMPS